MNFSDEEIFAGTLLILEAMRSPNYVPGSVGWSVNKDGSAEFNNIVIRGGTTTQGLILMYNGTPATGNLIGSISAVAGTDTFGNTYGAGFNFGKQPGAHYSIDANGVGVYSNPLNQQVLQLNPVRQAMFVYGGTPTLGNLNISIASVAGSDFPGNTFAQGITVQNGGAVTAKDTAGNTAVLTGNIPGGGPLGANPGMAMQPVRNTGDPATIGAVDPGGPLPVDMSLLLTSPSPVVGGLPGTNFAQIYMNGPNGAGSKSGVSISAGNVSLNGTNFNAAGVIDSYAGLNTYVPTVTGGGTMTFTSRSGWWQRIGPMIFFNAYIVVNAAGSGAVPLQINAPTNIDRSNRQTIPAHISAVTGPTGSGEYSALCFTGGTGSLIDRLTRGGVNLNGGDVGAGALITVEGWYREA